MDQIPLCPLLRMSSSSNSYSRGGTCHRDVIISWTLDKEKKTKQKHNKTKEQTENKRPTNIIKNKGNRK